MARTTKYCLSWVSVVHTVIKSCSRVNETHADLSPRIPRSHKQTTYLKTTSKFCVPNCTIFLTLPSMMSTPNIYPQHGQSISDLDRRIMDGLQSIRDGVLHLLRSDQLYQPSAEDVRKGMQTLQTTADTTWQLAERQRFWAEIERTKAQTAHVIAETERIRAQKM